MWGKIIVASLPAAIIGIPFDDTFTALFYNYWTVAIMLILFGVLFIVVENHRADPEARGQPDLRHHLPGGAVHRVLQLIAAVFPGTSRSGAASLRP